MNNLTDMANSMSISIYTSGNYNNVIDVANNINISMYVPIKQIS